jgi:hypothetical protein
LLSLPPNRWVKLHQAEGKWRRSSHAGSAFDLRRGTFVVFGSDTHGTNWDNAVHTFDPYEMRWTSSYAPAAKSSYRRDEQGIAVAGLGVRQPWAMHTFDGIIVDPLTDSLVVLSAPYHNPIKKRVRGAKTPNWSFDLTTGEWKDLPFAKGKYPIVFAAASAYDSARNVIVAYPGKRHGGIWELGPGRRGWKKTVAGARHEIHHTMVYDTHRKKLVVFGDFKGSRDVWEYTPGPRAYDGGTWKKRTPVGDCPALESAPVAYDSEHRRFIAIAAGDTTCLYEPVKNRFNRLDVETPKAGGMNYMLQYDPYHQVFLLVTGNHRAPPVVWGFKLAPKATHAGG